MKNVQTRVLRFTGDYKIDGRHFHLMQQAYCTAAPSKPDGQSSRYMFRALEVLRVEAAVLEKLDEISQPAAADDPDVQDAPPGVPRRVLRHDVAQLVLTQPELDLIRERVDPERMIWTPLAAGDVVRLVDWLAAAETVAPSIAPDPA
jgi:hypothetical protein